MTCPKPCEMVYETFASPRLLDPSYHPVKGALDGLGRVLSEEIS